MLRTFNRAAIVLSLSIPLVLSGAQAIAENRNQAQEQFQAMHTSQCASASQQFSQTNFNRAKAQIEATNMDASLKARRIEQANQFWMVSRYNSNVTRCRAWFERGRTSPFSPG